MLDIKTWKMAWSILNEKEKTGAIITLVVVIIGSFAAAGMVGSIMPFLAVMTDPSLVSRNKLLLWLFQIAGFETTQSFVVALGFLSLFIIILSISMQIIKNWVVIHFSMSKMHSISMRLLEKYMSQPYEFFLNQHSGELSSKVLTEVDKAVFLFYRPASEFIASSFTIITIVTLLVWINPFIAITSFVILGGIYLGISLLARKKLHQLGVVRFEENNQKFRIANDALTGIKDIKLLGQEFSYVNKYSIPSSKMANVQIKTSLLSSIPSLCIQAIALGGMIIICITLLSSQNDMTDRNTISGLLPLLGVFALAGQRLLPEFTRIYGSFVEMQAGAPVIKALYFDLLINFNDIQIKSREYRPTGLKKSLSLEKISYKYPNSQRLSIDDISVKILAGEKIGIVGSSGSGKTTLADVILGLLEPKCGKLIVDDSEIDNINVHFWMQSVGYVPQDIFLTDASIAENIALGVHEDQIDINRVMKAACTARIHDFIVQELPHAYSTKIGERGIRLSGGQRQRIGIARALYYEADLIVFDEATSALDNITEQEVMDAIDTLPGDKTILLIAHRLSTVKRCDRIIVLEKGKIIAFDNWNNLLEKNHVFRRIARLAE